MHSCEESCITSHTYSTALGTTRRSGEWVSAFRQVQRTTPGQHEGYLHEFCHKEHAAGLQTGAVELHNVAMMQCPQHPHLRPISHVVITKTSHKAKPGIRMEAVTSALVICYQACGDVMHVNWASKHRSISWLHCHLNGIHKTLGDGYYSLTVG